MADSNKRKGGPGDDRDNKYGKKSKGGSGGKWQTPHQKNKASTPRGGKIEPGDAGIWATCMKSKEAKATEELKSLFEHAAEKFYNISEKQDEDEEEEEDIEASIQRELQGLEPKRDVPKLFQPVFLDVQCVLFFKTRPPIDPVSFVRRICEDAVQDPRGRRHRFLNRLTPMTRMGRATERELGELARGVLGREFRLVDGGEGDGETACSYAIRPTIRNHNALKRNVVIDTIANLIHKSHKVSLTNPDKVILVELYQNICGISVVGRDWESLKRFNLNELYTPTPKPGAAAVAAPAPEDVAAAPNSVTAEAVAGKTEEASPAS